MAVLSRRDPLIAGWRRWFALFCVLLLGGASTAQAAHTHGVAVAGVHQHWDSPETGTDGSTGEEHCPLCVAMHSAMPAQLPVAPAPVSVVVPVPHFCAERDVSAAWHFPSFSRPPPASL